jgi:hypothetical protein
LYINQFIAKTKRVYKVLAREVAQEIEDYKKSGVEILGVIAINGSPTCGNSVSMDLRKSADLLINIDTNKKTQNFDIFPCNFCFQLFLKELAALLRQLNIFKTYFIIIREIFFAWKFI